MLGHVLGLVQFRKEEEREEEGTQVVGLEDGLHLSHRAHPLIGHDPRVVYQPMQRKTQRFEILWRIRITLRSQFLTHFGEFSNRFEITKIQ